MKALVYFYLALVAATAASISMFETLTHGFGLTLDTTVYIMATLSFFGLIYAAGNVTDQRVYALLHACHVVFISMAVISAMAILGNGGGGGPFLVWIIRANALFATVQSALVIFGVEETRQGGWLQWATVDMLAKGQYALAGVAKSLHMAS